MGETATPSRATMVDGILLALSHSDLQPLARSKQLATILHIDLSAALASGTLDLQVLWDLLAEEPGFDPAAADAPMCTLKGWSEQLGVDVRLPDHLRDLSDRAVALKTTECTVPAQEVRRVFDRHTRRAPPRVSVGLEFLDGGDAPLSETSRPVTWRDHPAVAWISGGLAVLALAFVAVTFARECRSAGWTSFDPVPFAAGIPLRGAEQLGDQVGAVLADPTWLSRPEPERRDQMETALRGLAARNVSVFFVKDDTGRVRATAQWYEDRRRIRVAFR